MATQSSSSPEGKLANNTRRTLSDFDHRVKKNLKNISKIFSKIQEAKAFGYIQIISGIDQSPQSSLEKSRSP
jgi:hypothetical protein